MSSKKQNKIIQTQSHQRLAITCPMMKQNSSGKGLDVVKKKGDINLNCLQVNLGPKDLKLIRDWDWDKERYAEMAILQL